MTDLSSFLVARDDLAKTRFVSERTRELQSGEILLKVDRFAFTANNITYAETGVILKYWQFFPAPDGWGIVPVWGFADVIESHHPAIKTGERVFGYMPMATHLLLQPDRVDADWIFEATAHRRELPTTYNLYRRTAADSMYDARREDFHSIMVPLFGTSFLIDDFLADQQFFGASVVIMSSASSKTAFSLAQLLHRRGGIETVGITSSRNRRFVTDLGCYTRVLTYDELGELPSDRSTVFVDFAGDGKVRVAVHERLRDRLTRSIAVGMTHRDLHPPGKGLPGAKPEFFFAPEQRRKRIEQWGRDAFLARYIEAWNAFVPVAEPWLQIRRSSGPGAVARIYLDTLNGGVAPERGNILSF